jgi:hypothetical protein
MIRTPECYGFGRYLVRISSMDMADRKTIRVADLLVFADMNACRAIDTIKTGIIVNHRSVFALT